MSVMTSGVLSVHCVPAGLSPHVEWAVSRVLGTNHSVTWLSQPLMEGTLRTEVCWSGLAGTGARLVSALRGWRELRFDVTEAATPTTDGARWSHTPTLGIFHGATDSAGNIVVSENRLRAILDFVGSDAELLHEGVRRALGEPWDAELDAFRGAHDEHPIRLLYRVS
jgi:hypothetical protein